MSTDRTGGESLTDAELGVGPASACPPSSNVVWEIQPTSWPQSAGAPGRADKRALKDELQPWGCRLIIFPTHLIDRTHGATGNGLASADAAGKRRGVVTGLGSFSQPSPQGWGLEVEKAAEPPAVPQPCLLSPSSFASLPVSMVQGANTWRGSWESLWHTSSCAFQGWGRVGRGHRGSEHPCLS